MDNAISIGSGAMADASVTTWTGRKRGASVNDEGEGCAGRSARSFQRHQYSCFGLYPSRRANFSALSSPLSSHRSTRLAHSAFVAIASSFVAMCTGNRPRRGGTMALVGRLRRAAAIQNLEAAQRLIQEAV
ncbi:hypothetical protein WME73_18360 [Sorangium sp. So ce302]